MRGACGWADEAILGRAPGAFARLHHQRAVRGELGFAAQHGVLDEFCGAELQECAAPAGGVYVYGHDSGDESGPAIMPKRRWGSD